MIPSGPDRRIQRARPTEELLSGSLASYLQPQSPAAYDQVMLNAKQRGEVYSNVKSSRQRRFPSVETLVGHDPLFVLESQCSELTSPCILDLSAVSRLS